MSTRKLKEVLENELGPFTFGRFLRAARVSKDLSQTQMAKLLNISKSTLCDIEKERQRVSPALASKIAKKSGFSESVAVEAAIRDQLRHSKLYLEAHIRPLKKAA
ncbi:helix-turn-helix transcriptional regulator [Candidatus Nomurabacteria bacterium]|nr:helix-turn-helix transcriptional regulator [Candidatus Nomurabacteria bacterium]